MRPWQVRAVAAVLAALGLAGAAPYVLGLAESVVRAQPTPVEQAVRDIRDIHVRFHCGLFVRTFEALPAAQRRGLRPVWARKLAEEARARAEAAGVDGVYLEIYEQPRYVLAVVWPPAKERVFTSADCEELRRKVIRLLNNRKPDDALLEAVRTVRLALERNRADLQTEPVSETFLGGVLVALVVGWVLLSGVRRRLRPPAPVATDLAAAEWQTRLGLPAGAWLADRVFLAHQASPPLAKQMHQPPPPTSADEEASIESLP
jgi:hypothetical protein